MFARVGIRVVVGSIKSARAHTGQGAAALHIAAHGHQHALDIGVVNDWRAGRNGAINRTTLNTVFSELHSLLVGALGNRNALHSDAIARGVHHDEHVL